MRKIIRFIKISLNNPKKLILIIASKGFLRILPNKLYLKLIFYLRIGYLLNLRNPKSFNEKLQWLKVNDHNPFYVKLVDKYLVREYLTEVLGIDYNIPLIGVYNSFDDIDFDSLPNEFVLKCTHDSGGVIICKDKSEFNKNEARVKINYWMKRNYYYLGREWPYKAVKRRIICERYMVDDTYQELRDYKFMCFNGKVKCEFICLNRNKPTGLNVDFYDLNWEPMRFERHYPTSGLLVEKPINFNLMIEIAEQLSINIPFLRVDFYEINGTLYIGELTLYPGSGFEEFNPVSYDYLLGSWLDLSE